jgi:hypothetical protein
LSAGGGQRIVGCPHHARNIGGASALQALRRLRIAVERRKTMRAAIVPPRCSLARARMS